MAITKFFKEHVEKEACEPAGDESVV